MKLVLFALGSLLMPNFAAAQEVEMSIRNRTGEPLTVFAQWDFGGTRDRLGTLNPNQTRDYTTEIRGEQVTVTVQLQGGRDRIGGDRPEWMVDARPGEKIEWTIRGTDPFDLGFTRVSAVTADGGGGDGDGSSVEPKMTTQLLRTQSGIQEAQGMEDDSLRTLAYSQVLVMVNVAIEEEDPNPMAYLHLAIAQAGLKNYFAADSAFDQAEALYAPYFDEDLGTGAYRLNAWIDAYTGALNPHTSVQFVIGGEDRCGKDEKFALFGSDHCCGSGEAIRSCLVPFAPEEQLRKFLRLGEAAGDLGCEVVDAPMDPRVGFSLAHVLHEGRIHDLDAVVAIRDENACG